MKREHISHLEIYIRDIETDLVASVAMNTTMTSRIFETETVLNQVTW